VEEDWKREIEEGEKGREREKRETWTGGSLEVQRSWEMLMHVHVHAPPSPLLPFL
jgi:hypothetical protein